MPLPLPGALLHVARLSAEVNPNPNPSPSPSPNLTLTLALTLTLSLPVAELLQRSPWYVMLSTRKPAEWWSYGLVKAQPVAKLIGFKTTGGEGMTMYVYVNLEKVPQLPQA